MVLVHIELTTRSANMKNIVDENELKDGLLKLRKNILFLFNEYKLIVESVLLENSIPFEVFF